MRVVRQLVCRAVPFFFLIGIKPRAVGSQPANQDPMAPDQRARGGEYGCLPNMHGVGGFKAKCICSFGLVCGFFAFARQQRRRARRCCIPQPQRPEVFKIPTQARGGVLSALMPPAGSLQQPAASLAFAQHKHAARSMPRRDCMTPTSRNVLLKSSSRGCQKQS